jgi:hypothetical protein
MVAGVQKEIQDVLTHVAQWPVSDRMVLARRILETVDGDRESGRRGFSAEEVRAQLNIPQPAPDAAACRLILEEELLRKHGS